MSHEHHAGIAVEDLRREMQLMLAGEIHGESGALGPLKEMPVIARPSRRGVLVGIAIGKGPLHVRIARHAGRRGDDLERHARRVRRQHHEASAPGPLGADGGCELVAAGTGDALVVVRSAPCIVGRPRSRRGHLEDAAGLRARRRPHDEEVPRLQGMTVAPFGAQGDAICPGRPVLADAKLQRRLPTASVHRALVGRILPRGAAHLTRQHGRRAGAIAQNLQPEARRGRAHAQLHAGAGRIRHGIGVAPDLAARTAHAGPLVTMAEHGLAALLGAEAEIGIILRRLMQNANPLERPYTTQRTPPSAASGHSRRAAASSSRRARSALERMLQSLRTAAGKIGRAPCNPTT